MAPIIGDRPTADRHLLKGLLGVALVAVLAFTFNVDRLPHPDELHHVLAGRSLLESGLPLIAEGTYTRGQLYTEWVAGSFALFGVSLWSARLPSVLCALVATLLLFGFTFRTAGLAAAAMAAIIFATSPLVVEIAQMSRFYAPQVLFFLLGSLLVFSATVGALAAGLRALLVILALPAFALALYFQITTVFGIAGVAAWALYWYAHQYRDQIGPVVRRRLPLILAAMVAVLLAAIYFSAFDIIQDGLATYRSSQLFNSALRDDHLFYLRRFGLLYGLFFLVTLIALPTLWREQRALTTFCLSVFLFGLVFNSFAGAKAPRYVVYVLPMLSMLFGLAAAALAKRLADYKHRLLAGWPASRQGGLRRLAVRADWRLLILVALFLGNPAWVKTAAFALEIRLPMESRKPDWRMAAPAIGEAAAGAEMIVTTEELGMLYFVGDYDVRFSPSKMEELSPDQQKEFGLDFRTGRPVVASLDALRYLVECFSSGILVGGIEDIGKPHLLNDEIWSYLLSSTEEVAMRADANMFMRRWPASGGPAGDAGDAPRVCDRFQWAPSEALVATQN